MPDDMNKLKYKIGKVRGKKYVKMFLMKRLFDKNKRFKISIYLFLLKLLSAFILILDVITVNEVVKKTNHIYR